VAEERQRPLDALGVTNKKAGNRKLPESPILSFCAGRSPTPGPSRPASTPSNRATSASCGRPANRTTGPSASAIHSPN